MSESHASPEQLSRLIDGDLSLAERAAVLDHVARCPLCAGEQARIVEVSAALRTVAPAGWGDEQTAILVARLASSPPTSERAVARRFPVRRTVDIVLAVATLVLVIAFVVAVPIGPVVAAAIWQGFSWLPPVGSTGAAGVGVALLAISLVAPVVAYPLARWR